MPPQIEWEWINGNVSREGINLDMEAMAAGQSGIGGPWITPENAMQQVVWSEAFVKGGDSVTLLLPKPNAKLGFYSDIVILAYPTGIDPTDSIVNASGIIDLTNQTTTDGLLT